MRFFNLNDYGGAGGGSLSPWDRNPVFSNVGFNGTVGPGDVGTVRATYTCPALKFAQISGYGAASSWIGGATGGLLYIQHRANLGGGGLIPWSGISHNAFTGSVNTPTVSGGLAVMMEAGDVVDIITTSTLTSTFGVVCGISIVEFDV